MRKGDTALKARIAAAAEKAGTRRFNAKLGIPTHMSGHRKYYLWGYLDTGKYLEGAAGGHHLCQTHRRPAHGNRTYLTGRKRLCHHNQGRQPYNRDEDVDEIAHLLDGQTVLVLQMEIPKQVLEYAIKTAAKARCTATV